MTELGTSQISPFGIRNSRAGRVFSHKKKKKIPFAATWMPPEIQILSEVSQREKQMPYDITCM